MPIALISVSDKKGIEEFAQKLCDSGYEIISTGGTYQTLKKAGLKKLKKVEEVTGFPEIMDGRVKTLQAKIYGGILADRLKASHLQQAKEHQIELIDLVVCNLYPFTKTVSRENVTENEAIENIDIGGVSLIRAAAKNYQFVTVVVDIEDYEEVLQRAKSKEQGAGDILEFRRELAKKAFVHTAAYDKAIADYFVGQKSLTLTFEKISNLRYGENPQQGAAWYKEPEFKGVSIAKAEILHGRELSFNNILDADSALNLILEFSGPAAAVIKHTNPCGCAQGKNITEAFTKAYSADSLSAFGGVIALNRNCTKEIAQEISKVFAEVVLAPDYEKEALIILKQKKNIRLLRTGELGSKEQRARSKDYKKITGGILEQDQDDYHLIEADLKTVTKKKPTPKQLEDLLFAWKVAKHVKSNAIVLAKGGVTVGIGAGQMSRVDAVEIAIKKGGEKVKDSVVASDGFFPFADSIEKLNKAGIISIIQPGGSIKDEEVIAAANQHCLSMVFTGRRAFKH